MNNLCNFRYISRFFTVIVLTLFCACSLKPDVVLRVGINAWPGSEFIYLAQEKGFYREEGVDVRLIEFSSLSDARRAYERGQIDVIGATVVEILQIRDQATRSPQIVQVVDYSAGADVILSQPKLKRGIDLLGRRIGVELGSAGIYVLARGLEKQGLTLDDVKVVSRDQLSMEKAFRQGKLDAVVTYPPTSIKLLRDTKANIIFSTAQIMGEVMDVIAVEAALNAQHPEKVSKFLRAYQRAIVYTTKNPADAYRIMAAREHITPEEFHDVLANDIKMVLAADQSNYFQLGGKLATVIDTSDRILRLTKQISGPDRRVGITNSTFVEKDPK